MADSAWTCEACTLDFTAEVGRCPNCLKMSSVQPADVVQRSARRVKTPAERQVGINAVLMLVLTAVHVLCTLSAAINLALMLSEAGEVGHPLAGVYPTYTSGVERTSALITLGWIGLWSAIGVFWAPLNAWGLFKRRTWARASTIGYWVASLLGCCCLPLGAYGLWSMGRKDVAEWLRPEEPAA